MKFIEFCISPPPARQLSSNNQCTFLVCSALSLTVIDTPGHTKGHISYHGHGCLFCGDTLFLAGCGRLFEGTAQQLQQSLQRLASLLPRRLCFLQTRRSRRPRLASPRQSSKTRGGASSDRVGVSEEARLVKRQGRSAPTRPTWSTRSMRPRTSLAR